MLGRHRMAPSAILSHALSNPCRVVCVSPADAERMARSQADSDPEQTLMDKVLSQDLEEALAGLNARELRVLLAYSQGLPVAQIARQEALAQETVYKILTRAREKATGKLVGSALSGQGMRRVQPTPHQNADGDLAAGKPGRAVF